MKRFSPATVLAALALFIALTGTATAGAMALITGAQIKNGSIGLVDLSNGAKSALKGRSVRGPAGTPGPQGLPGPAGPQGPAGVTQIKHYVSSPVFVAAGEIKGYRLDCPAGEGIASGGYYSSIMDVAASYASGNGWFVIFNNFDNPISISNAEVHIACAPGVATALTNDSKADQAHVARVRAAALE